MGEDIWGLEFLKFYFVLFEAVVEEFEVFFGGGEAFVADELADENKGSTGGKLLGDKGVAKIVDLGVFDASELKVAVNGGTDVSD